MGKIYQVTVVGIKGERKTVDVSHGEKEFNAMTVSGLKRKIAEKMPGQAGDDQASLRLLYADKQLDDGDTFEQHQIKDRSVIFLILRLPGGLTPPEKNII